jgi:hypothetical protein
MKPIIKHEANVASTYTAIQFYERVFNLCMAYTPNEVRVSCSNDKYIVIENYVMGGQFSFDYLEGLLRTKPMGEIFYCTVEVL